MLSSFAADRARVAALEAQILGLQNTLSALRLEQAQAQSRLDSYKYPVLTLPNEIIAEIFLHIPPPYPNCSSLTGTLSPTSLTHICREWRQIALSIPSLWRAMDLSNNDTPLEQRVYICDLWLKWSRSCPLSIEFDTHRDNNSAAESAVTELIASHCPYLKHLKLVVLFDGLDTIEGRSMPLLHHLDLDVRTLYDTKISFGQLPLLRSAVLSGLAALFVLLPWAQLTSLVLNKVYLDECVPILQQTSNLIHCELLRVYCPPDHAGVATLPCLESLVLKSMSFQNTAEYLQSFITPALHRLIISEQLLGHEPIRSLTNFISKSGAKLKEVHIVGRKSVPKNSYREALQSVPRLFFSKQELDHRISIAELEIESESDSSNAV
ncbi:F-box domain-containing protein [Mycena sanguinolenta]|uniref:F-box domain-containing protein n=1 Tax=Mycena sanguinolenta TaxID=230812 RepID=A0A8H6Y7L9_9AGAR|nr:F-box domain-containing protein [Mycena sanguinolenta]